MKRRSLTILAGLALLVGANAAQAQTGNTIKFGLCYDLSKARPRLPNCQELRGACACDTPASQGKHVQERQVPVPQHQSSNQFASPSKQ